MTDTPRWDTPAAEALLALARRHGSTALRVWHRGHLRLDWHGPPQAAGTPEHAAFFARCYRHGHDVQGHPREDLASQQKSVIAILAAIAADRGLLDEEAPVAAYLGAGWSRAPRADEAAIRVRHLLQMESGLSFDLEPQAPPGTVHHYNTPVYARLLPVLEAACGRPLDEITHDWLALPLGLDQAGWVTRGDELARHLGNPRGLAGTAPDLERLGRLVLDQGRAPDGTPLVSAARWQAIFTPTALNPNYGRLWWLNAGAFTVLPVDRAVQPGPFIPEAPADAVFALGSEGRMLMVVPSLELVAVRLGMEPGGPAPRRVIVAGVMQALASCAAESAP